MAVSYNMAVKNARLQVVVDALGADAQIVIGTSALAGTTGVLAIIQCATPSFTIANGIMTMASAPRTGIAVGTGDAAKAELRTTSGVVIASGLTVNTSDADFIINAEYISFGQTVQCSSGTITHAA